MKNKTILFSLLTMTITVACAQTPAEQKTFHVTAIRDLTSSDSAPLGAACATCWLVVSGTMGSLKYTTGQRTIGSHPYLTLSVGADYIVDRTDSRSISLRVGHDKKGKDKFERLFIMATEELPQ